MTRTLWIGGALICLAGLLLYGFETSNPNSLRWFAFSIAVEYILVVWACHGCRLPWDRLSWAVFAFLGYAALSLLWSVDWREGVLTFNQLFMMAVIFLAARHMERDLLLKTVSLFAVAGIVEHFVIHRTNPAIFGGLGNENFQAEFLVIIAPLACTTWVAWRNDLVRVSGVAAAMLSVAFAVFYNVSDAKWAAFAGMAGFAVLILVFHRRVMVAFTLSLIGLSAVGFAYNISYGVMTSVHERIELTYNTLMIWLDNPVFGTGIGGFNYAYPFHQEDHLKFMASHVVKSIHNYAGAAHDDFAQALAVFGLAGFGLLSMIGYLAFKCCDRTAWLAGFALFALMGAALVGFPMQNPSTALLAVLAAAVITKVPDAEMGVARAGHRLRLRSIHA